MTTSELARAYLTKALKRRRILDVLIEEESFSDVVREAQEIVELALKGVLRSIGVDPPKLHDVGGLVVASRASLAATVQPHVERLADISSRLRRERELSFYGDIDFVPTEEYSLEDAKRAQSDAEFVLTIARIVLESLDA